MAGALHRMIQHSWRVTPFKPQIKGLLKPIVESIGTSRLMPGCWRRQLRLYRILSFQYGHLRSAALMRSVDANGDPIPWITYPAIEFLKQLDLRDKTVFEYGCGGSTIFWGRNAGRVDSVEHNQEFVEVITPLLPSDCTLSLELDP